MHVGDLWKSPTGACVYIVTMVNADCYGRFDQARRETGTFGLKQYYSESKMQGFAAAQAAAADKVVFLSEDGYAAPDWQLIARL